jgi:hypothetical protein
MSVIRPWFSRPKRYLCSIAVLTAALLFALPGQRACASTLTGSWYLTDSNSTNFPSGSNYAQVSISVDSNDQATFNVNVLPILANSNYLLDKFAFNWAGSSDISSQLTAAIANASSPLNNWSVNGSNGSPAQAMDGMGKYNYEIDAQGFNNRVNPMSFTMDLSGLGLSQSDILNDFQVSSSGGNGGGYFAMHVASGTDSFYLGGSTPIANNPEPSALVSMAIAAGLLLCVFCWRYFAISIPVSGGC